jgi:hypothetical protein
LRNTRRVGIDKVAVGEMLSLYGYDSPRLWSNEEAKRLVQEQLRAEGIRLSLVPPREVQERATAYLRDHPEVWKEAIAKAHRLDEMEGQRKEKRKLRREQLARLVR